LGYFSRVSGEHFDFATPDDAYKARLARMRHLVWLAIRSMEEEQGAVGGVMVMYTLTYEQVGDWEPRHISSFARWLRQSGVKSYTWVAELQKRGAVHYHVLALLPAGQMWVKPNASHGGWARGFSWVTPDVKHPWYIMKYLQKGEKDGRKPSFPKGLRLYGISSWCVRRMSFDDSTDYRASQLPRWYGVDETDAVALRCAVRCASGVKRGGYVAISPYSLSEPKPVDEVENEMYTAYLMGCNLLPQ